MNSVTRSIKHAAVIFVILCCIICLPLIWQNAYAAEEIASGTCGDSVNWVLDEDGTLNITGSGNMTHFTYYPTSYSTITSVPWYDFRNSIRNIVIQDGVTSIGQYAFINCTQLTNISIPESVERIGEKSFGNCSSLTKIIIPNSVISITAEAFFGCSSLNKITIPFVGITPESTGIGGLFGNIFGLSSFDDSREINQYYSSESGNHYRTYYVPTALKEVVITGGGTIHYGAFCGCEDLTNITISENVTCIEGRAFNGCKNLKSLTIPFTGKTPTSTGEEGLFGFAFSTKEKGSTGSVYQYENDVLPINGCVPASLKEVTITGGNSIGECAFCGCSSVEIVRIPNSVISIGINAFKYCDKLVIICDSDSYAFSYADRNSLKYDLPSGHQFDSGVVTKNPSCVETGVKTFTCKTCKITETETVPATGHKWNTTYTVDIPATASASGLQSIHCAVCGSIKEGSSQVIPKLTPSTPTVTPTVPAAPTEIIDLPTVKISKPSAGKKKATVKWKKVSKKNLKKISGIQIQVATDPAFTNIVKTATAGKKKTSKVIKGLQSKTKYYVRIRAYGADNHVSNWKSKSVKVK